MACSQSHGKSLDGFPFFLITEVFALASSNRARLVATTASSPLFDNDSQTPRCPAFRTPLRRETRRSEQNVERIRKQEVCGIPPAGSKSAARPSRHCGKGRSRNWPQPLRICARRLLDSPTGSRRPPYRPGGWTAGQVLLPLPGSRLNAYFRFKQALTGENLTLKLNDESRQAGSRTVLPHPTEVSLAFLPPSIPTGQSCRLLSAMKHRAAACGIRCCPSRRRSPG